MSVITKTKECINVTVSNFNCQNPSSDIVECVWRPLFDTKLLNIEIKPIEDDVVWRKQI